MSRILLINDISAGSNSFEKKFAGLYCQFNYADNYHDALNMACEADNSIDLILIDRAISFIDAIEFCRIIKLKMSNYIPVVIIAYKEEEGFFTKAIDAGAEDIFFYPFDVGLLSDKIIVMIRMKELLNSLAARNKGFDFSKLNQYLYLFQDKKIVLISDDMAETYFIKKTINHMIQQIYCFENYADFFEANQGDADIFLVSTMLASEYGLEICTKIINAIDLKNRSIIIIADKDDKELLSHAIQIGVTDFITSPVKENELLAKLKRTLSKNITQKTLYDLIDLKINLANRDKLTGILNRNALDQALKKTFHDAKVNGTSLSVMMLDIDKFKLVNDTYGHLIGDEVLVETVARVVKMLNNTALVYRFGGEEFLVIYENSSIDRAYDLAEEIRLMICTQKYKISTPPFQIPCSVSIGIASVAESDQDPNELLARADKALYIAKNGGRNMVARA